MPQLEAPTVVTTPEVTKSKSVSVYSLRPPDRGVELHFRPAQDGADRHETAAVVSFVYTLTGARRPKPSVEPERTIYRNLRPWKDGHAVPAHVVVVADGDDLAGAPVLRWDGKMSLQGEPPWGRPVVGRVVGRAGQSWEVEADWAAVAEADRAETDKAEERKRRADQRERREAERLGGAQAPPERQQAAPEQPTQREQEQVEPEPELERAVILAPPPEPVEPIAVSGVAADELADYTGDPFTVADGHYVGDDGFVVPLDFDEFYARYPKYVMNWVKKRLNRFQVDVDVEDWTQDLLIHMKYLPAGSKHRAPGANGRVEGCRDVIETFNPVHQYGASERRFRNYINFCLANKFNTVQSKRQKNPVCRVGNVPFGASSSAEADGHEAPDDEYIHANSEWLAATATKAAKQHLDRLFTSQFKDYVAREDPSALPAIEALEATGPLGEAAAYMGVSEAEFARLRARLKVLGECFVERAEVPRARKPYKRRAAEGDA